MVFTGKSNNPYDVEFKLADLGLSHFKRVAKLDRRIADSDIGGTKDYGKVSQLYSYEVPMLMHPKGAPECYRNDDFLEQIKLNVQPSIDIWSFGGVCSEAAVWVVLGMSGLINYRHQRQQEICEKGTSQDGSCFHDGEKILRTVNAMHGRLLEGREIRAGDHVTRPVLEYMVDSMLEEDPGGRQNATWLWKKSQKILGEARLKLEETSQQASSRRGDSVVNKAQFYGLNLPKTPPLTSYGVAQPYNGNPHAHGPPPNLPQYGPKPPLLGQPSVKQTPKRRSDTWHEHSTGEISSPMTAGRQPFRISPPLDECSTVQELPEIHDTASVETPTRQGRKSWLNVNSPSYSPPGGSRDAYPLEDESVAYPGFRELSSPETKPEVKVHPAQQIHSDGSSSADPFRYSGAFRPPIELGPQQSNVAKVFAGQEIPHSVIGISGQARPTSPPITPPLPSTADLISTEPITPQTKPEKPFLSHKQAKTLRDARDDLPSEIRGLLNDLKDRDHVSYLSYCHRFAANDTFCRHF